MPLMLLLALASCRKPAPPVAPAPSPLPDMRDEMEDHFFHALEIQLAVMGGDLEGARKAATALESVTSGGSFPDAWAPYLEVTRGLAREVSAATTIPEAAGALGRLGEVCAQCHEATGGGPRTAVDERIPEERMGRHLYGTYWMFYGLAAPDDRAWLAGAVALASAEGPPPPGPEFAIERLRSLAQHAVDARRPEGRAALWGQMLSTCAECHATIPH